MFYLKLNVYLNVYINIFLPIWIFINSVIHSSSGAFFWNSQLHQWWIKFVLSRICIVNIYFDFRSSDRSISFFFFYVKATYARVTVHLFSLVVLHTNCIPGGGCSKGGLGVPPGCVFLKNCVLLIAKYKKKKNYSPMGNVNYYRHVQTCSYY